jgi:tRNA threonylcarbamoyl adenosine modification protein YeaZ
VTAEKPVNILAIDTATRRLNLALLYGEDRTVKSGELVRKTHGQILMKKIDDLFLTAALAVADLQAVVVSLGPGSFTGLRIGLAAAKGIAVARNIPLVGVTLFEAAALRLQTQPAPVHLLIPSRKGEFYIGSYSGSGVTEPEVRVLAERDIAGMVGSDQVYLIGHDPGLLETEVLRATARSLDYDGGDVLRAGIEKLVRGERADAAGLEPVYFQKAIAEIHFDRRHGVN